MKKAVLTFLNNNAKRIFAIFTFLVISAIMNFYIPFITQRILDDGILEKNVKATIFYSLSILLIYVLLFLINYIMESLRLKVYNQLIIELREKTFNQVTSISLDYFEKNNAVQIFQNCQEDTNKIAALLGESALSIVSALFSSVGITLALFGLNWKLSLFVLLFFLIGFLMNLIISKITYKYSEMLVSETQTFSEWFGDLILGIKEIKYWKLEENKKSQLLDKLSRISHLNIRNGKLSVFGSGISSILLNTLLVIVYILSAIYLVNAEIEIGTVVTFISFVSYLGSPISCLIGLVLSLAAILPSIKRFQKFMSEPVESIKSEIVLQNTKIEFENVSFSYGDKVILDNCSFAISKPDKACIIGSNGAGKTTLIKLILHAVRPTSGNVFIGGKNVDEYSEHSFRDYIAYVGQETFLFNDTIKNNICLYRNVDDSALNETLNLLNLDNLINDKGLDYVVGENGSKLSGGQRQKIAFARALVAIKPIVILDEVTSNMDSISVEKMKLIFDKFLSNSTVICVTHSKELLPLFDYCFELDNKIIRKNVQKHNESCSD